MRTRSILFVLAAALATSAIAQDENDDDTTTTTTPSRPTTTTTRVSPPTTTTTTTRNTDNEDEDEETTSLPGLDETTPTPPPTTTTITSTSNTRPTDTESVPPITSDTADTPPLPSIPGSYSYPPPAVPNTKNAPFMQKSTLPQGTVFIAVGAILGAFGVAILIWRSVVACLLHRSVRRATLAQQLANDKSNFAPPAAPFYKYSDQASSLSLGNAQTPGRGAARKPFRAPIPSIPSQSNLFYSPTAAAGTANSANRESRFLPAGFYASSAASPLNGHGHSISLTNLRPDSRGIPRAVESSPPDSPNPVPPQDLGRRHPSSSTLNLNRPTSGRAPSAYLEDLLADQPEQFPPPGHRNTWNQSSNRL